jgi:hypothetical protein
LRQPHEPDQPDWREIWLVILSRTRVSLRYETFISLCGMRDMIYS